MDLMLSLVFHLYTVLILLLLEPLLRYIFMINKIQAAFVLILLLLEPLLR